MSNPRATGKKAKHGENLIQRTRAAILNALDAVDKRGKLISEILADEFEKNPLKFMELASKACPKEQAIEHSGHIHQTHEHRTVSEIDNQIKGMLTDREDRDTAPSKPH